MILAGVVLLFLGICLSAFFSGSETGFYRASRLRIMMDAMQGDNVSRRLLFLTNRPPLFVATALVGNNTANYVTSLAIVLLTKSLIGTGLWMELAASIAFTPVVFVYGELMPKNLFYQAPNFLLRLSSRPILFFAVLFGPVSAMLWMLGQLLEKLFGQSPQKVRLALARKDLGDALIEGQHAGILCPTQLQLAQNFFLMATNPVSQWMTPLGKTPIASSAASPLEALTLAQRLKMTEIAVRDDDTGRLVGYLQTIELMVSNTKPGKTMTSKKMAGKQNADATLTPFLNPLIEVAETELHGEAIMRLQSAGEKLCQVVDESGRAIGILTLEALTGPLLGEPLAMVHGQSVKTGFQGDSQPT